MSIKTTLFLLLAFFVAAGLVWMLESERATSQEQTVQPRLLSFEPEKITSLAFIQGAERIECENVKGRWMIRQPTVARADHNSVNRILGTLEALPQLEIITAAQRQARELTAKEYGLAPPRGIIEMAGAKRRTVLQVGDLSPMGNTVFARVNDDANIMVTTTNLLAAMPRALDDIRDFMLLPGLPADVRKLEIKRAAGPFIQIVKEGTDWVIQKPFIARADWSATSAFLDNLFALSAKEFVTDDMGDPNAYGLGEDETFLQIGVWQTDAAADYLLFGQKTEQQDRLVFATLRGSRSLVKLNMAEVQKLSDMAGALRDPRLYIMAPEKMAVIRMEEGERALEFRRQNDQTWQITEPRQWPADAYAMAQLIERLNMLRGEPVSNQLAEAEARLAMPARIIRVATATSAGNASSAAGGTEKFQRVLLLSGLQPGQEYVVARFDGEPTMFQVSASSSVLSLDPLAYRDNTVLSLDSSAVRRIIFKHGGDEQTWERGDNAEWKQTAGVVETSSLEMPGRILSQVSNLKALRFEQGALQEHAKYGLKEPNNILTLLLSGEGGIQKTIFFGDHSEDGGVYAVLQGQDEVFVINPEQATVLCLDQSH